MTDREKHYLIWDPIHECMPRDKLRELQEQRLRSAVRRCASNVPFYQERWRQTDIDPDSIQSLEDLQRLPFTTKEDFRRNYPYGMLAVPLREVVRVHASSGTTGKATVVAYTKNDLDTWSELVARFITAAGVTAEDVVHISFGYGLFTGGFGLHYGAEKVGASVIPVSSGRSERQIQIMQDFRSTVLVCTPSYALHLAEVALESGVSADDLSLRVGLFGGEPWTQGMRKQIEARLGIMATDNYGLSEVIGPGVSGECIECHGLHIFEDHFIPEIIDPVSAQPLPLGEQGELVLTSLTKEASPVIRYRTHDLCRLLPGSCPCGRTMVRMSKVAGRADDMLIIRGVNVYPSDVEEVLMAIEGTEPHYQIVVDRVESLDVMTVHVEVSEVIFSDEMRRLRQKDDEIRKKLSHALGVSVEVRLVEPKTLERSLGKAKRVIDNRRA
jgi:phenylacetate-CoA ligase